MKLSIAPHPSLFEGEIHRTWLDVDPNLSLNAILDKCRHLLSLWLFPLGGDVKLWFLSLDDDIPLNLDDTPRDLQLQESQLIFVNLDDNLEDTYTIDSETSPIEPPNAFEVLEDGTIHTIPDSELQMFEQAKRSALNRATEICNTQGIKVSQRRIFHDEAVDDYDDDNFSELNFYDDVLALKVPFDRN